MVYLCTYEHQQLGHGYSLFLLHLLQDQYSSLSHFSGPYFLTFELIAGLKLFLNSTLSPWILFFVSSSSFWYLSILEKEINTPTSTEILVKCSLTRRFWNSKSIVELIAKIFNPFVLNAPFLYPQKTAENRKVFCFQRIEKVWTGIKWVNG